MTTPRQWGRVRFRWAAAPSIAILLFACGKDAPTCRVRGEGESRILLCDDGSKVNLRVLPPPVAATGILRGEARLFGRPQHDAITVAMFQTGGGHSTSTRVNPDGTWELEVPAGIYDLRYHAPGYGEDRQDQVVVAPGIGRAATVILRSGRMIHPESPSRIQVMPDEQGLLLFYREPGPLWYWTPGRGAEKLSDSAARVEFTPLGKRIAFLDDFGRGSPGGTLVIVDPAGRTRETIADDVRNWKISRDEGVVVAEQNSSRLVVWKAGEGASVVTEGVAAWSLAPSGRTVMFLTRVSSFDFHVVHWDVPASGGSNLDAQWQTFEFSPGGESFIYADGTGESVLWDGLRNRPVPLGIRRPGELLFGPDGQWLLFPAQDGWKLIDLSTPVPMPVDDRVDFALFAEDSSALYFGRSSMGSGVLSRRNLATGDTQELVSGVSMARPKWAGFTGDRSLVFSMVAEAGSKQRLLSWSPRTGLTTLSGRIDGQWSISPDESSVAFYEDGHLVVVSLLTGERRASDDLANASFLPAWNVGIRQAVDPWREVLFQMLDGSSRFAIFVVDRALTVSLGDWVLPSSCRLGEGGPIACLARTSRSGGGSELVRWAGADAASVIADGVLEFNRDSSGQRLALRTRAIPSTGEDLLLLVDPTLAEPVAIADSVRQPVVTREWVAWIRDDPDQGGAFYSVFPSEPLP